MFRSVASSDRILRAGLLLTGCLVVVSGLTLPLLPERVAIHFNVWGRPDAYVSKYVGVFVVPVLSLVFALLAVLFRSIPSWILVVVNSLLFLAHVLGTVLPNLGVRWSIAVLLTIVVSAVVAMDVVVLVMTRRRA